MMSSGAKNTDFSGKFDYINKKADELAGISAEDAAVFQKIKNDIIGQMLSLETYYFKSFYSNYGKSGLENDIFSGIYLDSILECIKKFTPEKQAKFTTYFKNILTFRVKDGLSKFKTAISLDAVFDDDSNAPDLYSKIESLQNLDITEKTEEVQIADSIITELIMYVVELLTSLYVNKNNTLMIYYKLFYTSRLVDLIKNEPSNNSEICLSLKFHEREAIGVAEKELLYFTYAEKADTIDKIYFCKLKKYNQIPYIDEKSKTDKYLDIPYRNKILLAYLTFEYKKEISDAMISKMKKKFDSEIVALRDNF